MWPTATRQLPPPPRPSSTQATTAYARGHTGTAKTIPATKEMFWGLEYGPPNENLISVRQHRQPQQGYQLHRLQLLPETHHGGGTNPPRASLTPSRNCEGRSRLRNHRSLIPHPKATSPASACQRDLLGRRDVWRNGTPPLPRRAYRSLYPVGCGDATLTGYQTKKWLQSRCVS